MSEYRRVQNWPTELDKVIIEYQTHLFEWGKSDCGTFAADVVRAITGIEIYQEFKGRYNTARSFAKLLIDCDSRSISELFDLVAGENGFNKIEVNQAHRGDIVANRASDMTPECLGVISGPKAIFHANDGLISVDRSECVLAWSIQ